MLSVCVIINSLPLVNVTLKVSAMHEVTGKYAHVYSNVTPSNIGSFILIVMHLHFQYVV